MIQKNVGKIVLLFLIFILSLGIAFASPWDILRPAINILQQLNLLIILLFIIVSLIVSAIAFTAYKNTKSQKILFVMIAFFLFSLKALMNLVDFFVSPGIFMNFAIQGFFDLLIIAFLFIALFKR